MQLSVVKNTLLLWLLGNGSSHSSPLCLEQAWRNLFALEGGHHAGPQARIVPVSYGLLSRKGIYVLCENRELF